MLQPVSTLFSILDSSKHVEEPSLLMIATTGMLTQHDDVELGIMADHILSLGAPKTGLLNGQFEELYRDYPYRDFRVADIGVPGIAWKRCGKRGRYGVEFRGEWVVRVDYWGGLE